MKNTGTWNSDFAIFLVLLMLLPLFIHFLAQIIRGFTNPVEIEQDEDFADFENIKRTALIQAAQGNHSARNWVTKHVFNEQQVKTNQLLTDQKIVDDTIAALVAIKHKKSAAKEVAYRLGSAKKYSDVSSLFLESIKEL